MTRRTLAALLLTLALLPATPAGAHGGYLANVSAYCDQGWTASGRWTAWGTAAGASWLPLGSIVAVSSYGDVLVTDRGVPGLFDLDLSMPGDCGAAWNWGRRWLPITVLRWGWGS